MASSGNESSRSGICRLGSASSGFDGRLPRWCGMVGAPTDRASRHDVGCPRGGGLRCIIDGSIARLHWSEFCAQPRLPPRTTPRRCRVACRDPRRAISSMFFSPTTPGLAGASTFSSLASRHWPTPAPAAEASTQDPADLSPPGFDPAFAIAHSHDVMVAMSVLAVVVRQRRPRHKERRASAK